MKNIKFVQSCLRKVHAKTFIYLHNSLTVSVFFVPNSKPPKGFGAKSSFGLEPPKTNPKLGLLGTFSLDSELPLVS